MEMVSLEISREEELSETVRQVFRFCTASPTNGLKEKAAMKNACDGVATALKFIKTRNYFYFNSFISFFEIVLFIWLNPLVPAVPSLFNSVFHYAEAVVRRCSSK